jgi:outer membrane protein OmpA-like peptidoglycan-associated protein
VTVSLPTDERNKFYGEVVYRKKKNHYIEDFFGSPMMVEIQNKIKSDLSGLKSKKKNISAQQELMINTSVEVFYPKLEGFIKAKSFAKVRLVMSAIVNASVLIKKKYESLYVTNGSDNEFEGDISMTVEDGENVTVGMALRKCLDQFYSDLNQVLTINENSIIVYGKVTGSKRGEGVIATISFRPDARYTVVSGPGGSYQLVIAKAKYNIQTVASGFMSYQEDFDAQASMMKMQEIDFKLQPIEAGRVVSLRNVLFQVGTTNLLQESFLELDDVVTFLKSNRKVKIELQGHTDNRGNAAKDLELSQQRVEVIKAYLVANGITSGRIKGRGFGASKPIASNSNEEGRKLNRRVEFVIIKN